MKQMGMIKRLLPAAITAVVAVQSASAAARDETDGSIESSVRGGMERPMEDVIVTATRVETDLSEVARSLSVVGRQEIESIQPQSVAQALSYLPNITVAGGPRAANQSVNIRGLGGNKVLQTIDGARQDFESGHRPTYFLDPELLDSVEALRGPASSLWGSGALGGVVAQNTITADSLLAPGESLGGFVRTGYNDNNEQSTTTLAMVGRAGRADWLVSGYYRDSDDLELGNGDDLLGSGSEDKGAMTKVNWRVDDKQALQFSLWAADVDGSVPANAAAEINGTSNFMLERDQQTHNASIRYNVDGDSDLLDAQVISYWNHVEMDEQRIEDGRADQTELDTYGINLFNVSRFGEVSLLYGADAYREEFETERGGAFRPSPPEATSEVWSVYTQLTVPLVADLRTELGVRYDDFSTEADNLNQQRGDSDTSLSAALVWDAAEWATVALRYDEAFRAPGAEELYSSGYHFCMGPGFCNSFQPNPDLDPEQAANIELIGQLQFSNLFDEDAFGIRASVFQNEVDNFIEQVVSGPFFFPVQDPGTTSWVNVDEATLEGFEVEATYAWRATALKLGYGQTRGEDDNTGEDLTNVPADTFTADLSQGLWRDQLVVGVRFTHADDQSRTDYEENVNSRTYDSYDIVDLYLSWQPDNLEGLKIDLNINNLDDEYYRRAWEELPESGREIILSAKYSF